MTPEVIPPGTRPRLSSRARVQMDKITGKPVMLYPEGALILNPTGHLRDHAAESTARESYISAVTMAGLTFVFPSRLGSAAKEKPTLASFLTSPFLLRPA